MGPEFHVSIVDQFGVDQRITVTASTNGLYIEPQGYGDFSSNDCMGVPIALDFDEDELRLLVWADINQENPTHIIPLAGAKESARKS